MLGDVVALDLVVLDSLELWVRANGASGGAETRGLGSRQDPRSSRGIREEPRLGARLPELKAKPSAHVLPIGAGLPVPAGSVSRDAPLGSGVQVPSSHRE